MGRYLREAHASRMRLGGSGDMAQPFPWKPKGMHWRTYWRLREEERQAYAEAVYEWMVNFKGLAARFGANAQTRTQGPRAWRGTLPAPRADFRRSSPDRAILGAPVRSVSRGVWSPRGT